jgi:maltose/moltooligosaccharide transporter
MAQKPNLSFWQIWNMSFGFLGIQFGFALQNTNVSRIFQTLGASIEDVPILWVAAPVTGLIVQPIIGYMSDRTWGRLGRRRPYFFYGAIASSLALLVMPNSPTLWVAAGMLWILDASINVAVEPFRGFVGDMLPDKQRTLGYAMQSFFVGVGAVVASVAPWVMTNWLGISNTAPEGVIPPSVIYAFYIGAAILLATVLWTVFSTKEYSPEQLEAFHQKQTAAWLAAAGESQRSSTKYWQAGCLWLLAGLAGCIAIGELELSFELYVLAIGAAVFGILQLLAGALLRKGHTNNGVYHVTHDLFHMPKPMQQLAVVQMFSWFALFTLWIYTTAAVTSYHFGAQEVASESYNEGADWVGVLFASYNGFAALAAFVIPLMVRYTSRKLTHAINLSLGGLGLIFFVVIKDPLWLLAPMVGLGFAWASISSMPYAILASSLPPHKMGVYMGIFNFFIVIPQILAASILGIMMRELFEGQTIYAMVCAGACLLLAAVATLFVDDEGEQAPVEQEGGVTSG